MLQADLCFAFYTSGIKHFSRELWFLLLEFVFRNQDVDTKLAILF